MVGRFEEGRRAIEESVLEGRGETARSLREAVAARSADVPQELAALVAKVHDHAYRVTDEDIVKLRGRYSEDELFEIIVSASVGAAKKRLDAGLRALRVR